MEEEVDTFDGERSPYGEEDEGGHVMIYEFNEGDSAVERTSAKGGFARSYLFMGILGAALVFMLVTGVVLTVVEVRGESHTKPGPTIVAPPPPPPPVSSPPPTVLQPPPPVPLPRPPPQDWSPTVLVISLDGFSNEYFNFDSQMYPNLYELAENGLRAERMKPVFPSKTFPNHYSIATGLYPPWHGIVSNSMYDEERNELFTMGNNDGSWWGGNPLWLTAKRQGKNTAAMFWPGSDKAIGPSGEYPTYYRDYDKRVTPEEKVHQVLEWLSLPDDLRPSLIYLYFNEPDHTGHDHGASNNAWLYRAIMEVDSSVGQLLRKMTPNARKHTNVFVVSDHGMTTSEKEDVIILENFGIMLDKVSKKIDGTSNTSLIDGWYSSSSPVISVFPVEGKESDLYAKFKKVPHTRVFYDDTIDQVTDWHYCCNERIGKLVVVVDSPYVLTTSKSSSYYARKRFGSHGYDNSVRDMQAILIAQGPNIQVRGNDDLAPPILNIELYSMMAEILQITPSPNNSTLSLDDLYLDYLRQPTVPFPPE
eukprot:CAMPEP_0119129888 /NCGR_PEP_ID=MMETSP1310-20130426/7447_1 /TAXON_ID=464262 /ORGANISM="Genus nov. species nov., Strain RCC2339" /LENGTH=532 /DNA_ID=CAMNT_0007120349 /DNA_START=115 /DNA_END=1710 /DNA_ORIENTATION=+